MPITQKALNKVLINPYYKGVITYMCVEYAGSHPAMVDAATWQLVQDVLASHINGERTRRHPHFLKGNLYYRNCGSRMVITYAKSKTGVRYPYYVCAGFHSKRKKDCRLKAVLIDEMERQVEQIYDHYSFPPSVRKYLENFYRPRSKTNSKNTSQN